MAGYGFSDGIKQYQQGLAWKEQQDQLAQGKEADAAFKDTLGASQKAYETEQAAKMADWLKSGKAEGEFQAQPWKPSDTDYLAATQARQTAFAKQGNFDGYMKSAAAVAPMVAQIRKNALDTYGNDEAELAKKVYPTFFDNREVKSADWVDSSGPQAGLDGKNAEKQLRITLSDGKTQFFKPGQVSEMVSKSIESPQMMLAAAKNQFEMKKAQFTAQSQAQLEDTKQSGRLKLEDVKASNAKDLAGVNNNFRLGQIGAMGSEARKTKTTPGAPGSGGAGGAASSLPLRALQQQRQYLDSRRTEARHILETALKSAKDAPYMDRSKVQKSAQDAYDATMKSLETEDGTLRKRLETLQRSGGRSLGDIEAGSDASPVGPKPVGADGIVFDGWVN